VLFFIIGGAILALTTTLNATFMWGTKSLLIIVDDQILPEKLGSIHEKFGTPHVMLLFVWVFSMAGILSGLSLKTLASYTSLGGLLIFFPVLLAALKLPGAYPKQYKKAQFKLRGFWLWFCPIVGITMALFFSVILLVDLKSPMKIAPFFLFIISGILFYQVRKRYLKKRGVDLEALKSGGGWHG
jgi:APA family basic amino acid/polyamine antiporter